MVVTTSPTWSRYRIVVLPAPSCNKRTIPLIHSTL